jgi:hypothetical protein
MNSDFPSSITLCRVNGKAKIVEHVGGQPTSPVLYFCFLDRATAALAPNSRVGRTAGLHSHTVAMCDFAEPASAKHLDWVSLL